MPSSCSQICFTAASSHLGHRVTFPQGGRAVLESGLIDGDAIWYTDLICAGILPANGCACSTMGWDVEVRNANTCCQCT